MRSPCRRSSLRNSSCDAPLQRAALMALAHSLTSHCHSWYSSSRFVGPMSHCSTEPPRYSTFQPAFGFSAVTVQQHSYSPYHSRQTAIPVRHNPAIIRVSRSTHNQETCTPSPGWNPPKHWVRRNFDVAQPRFIGLPRLMQKKNRRNPRFLAVFALQPRSSLL
jgi:hypothetical protein